MAGRFGNGQLQPGGVWVMQRNRCTAVTVVAPIVVLLACVAMALSPLGSLVLPFGGGAPTGPASASGPVSAAVAHVDGDFGGATCTVTVTGENGDNDAIQSAINSVPSGSTVCVAAGTYPEQLSIAQPLTLIGAGNGSTILEPNAPLVANTFDFDSSSTFADLTPAVAIVLVANTTGVAIDDLTVSGAAAASTFTGCGVDFYGIDFQDSSGSVLGSSVTGVELPAWLFGCQPGVELYAYNGYFFTGHAPSPSVQVSVTNSTFTDYDKGGIVCDDLGELCQIADNTVVGVGANTSIAQNGIQVAFGASANVLDNSVSGNHYTGPTASPDDDYFAPGYLSTGILVFDGGNAINVSGNVLSGNDLGISVYATAVATVTHNDVEQGYAYGITLDLNATLAYVGLPIYSTATPWLTTAGNNTIQNVNVGLLIYDDSVFAVVGTISGVNVGVESVLDNASATYSIALDDFSVTANVSGALLGNISSFQSTAGFYPKDVGSYFLGGDAFGVTPGAPVGSIADGVAFNASVVSVYRISITGFAVGLFVNPDVGTATVQLSTIVETPNLAEPEAGIWAGNLVYPTTLNTGTIQISNTTVLGPGGGPGAPVAGGTGIMVGGSSVVLRNDTVANFSAVSSSGGGNGYDWWEGTQSAGVQVGCPPSATTCLVQGNTLDNDAIGLVVLLTNSSFSAAYATGPITVEDNLFNDSGGYGLFTEMVWTGGPRDVSTIRGNTFNDTLSGAPAMVLSGQSFDVTNNVLIGTSTSGNQGAAQEQGGGPLLDTASIEATDYWTTGYTTVLLNENLFLDTSLYWNATFASFATGTSTLSGGVLATFNEEGLPSGTNWTMSIAGTSGYVSAPATMVADLQNSSNPYPFVAGTVPGYAPVPASGTLTASGSALTQTIVYGLPTYEVTFTESGVPTGLTWYLNLTNGQQFSSSSSTIAFAEPDGNYAYAFGGTLEFPKYYSALPGTFVVSGSPVSVHAVFTESRQVVVTEHGLPTGMSWWVNFTAPYSFSSSGTTLTLYVPAGHWTYTVQAANHDYHAAGHSFTVHSPLTSPHVALRFTATFRLTKTPIEFTETGLPSGSRWCVVITSGGITCSRSRTLSFSEPNGTYDYTLATSRAGYSGTGGSFEVPETRSVAVTFSSDGGAAARPAAADPLVGTPSTVHAVSGEGLGILVASLGVGLIVARRAAARRSRAPTVAA